MTLDRAQANAAIDAALAAAGIYTSYLIRLDFKSGTQCIWTGQDAMSPSGTGDAKLDGQVCQPVMNGVPYDIGTNKSSEQGSDAFELTVAIPADVPPELQASSISKDEYAGRPAIVWRGILIQQPGLGSPGIWQFRRIRSGFMDQLSYTQDATQNVVKLTIESWAAMISGSSQSSYADQQRFDPNDTSQNWLGSTTTGQPIASNTSTRAARQTVISSNPYQSRLQ